MTTLPPPSGTPTRKYFCNRPNLDYHGFMVTKQKCVDGFWWALVISNVANALWQWFYGVSGTWLAASVGGTAALWGLWLRRR